MIRNAETTCPPMAQDSLPKIMKGKPDEFKFQGEHSHVGRDVIHVMVVPD